MKKIVLIVGALIILVILLFLIFQVGSSASQPTGSSSSAGGTSGSSIGNPISVTGWLKCLTPKTASSSDCMIGVEDSTGQNYGLINPNGDKLDPTQLTTGSRYSAVGNLSATPDFLKDYNLTGIIKLSQ